MSILEQALLGGAAVALVFVVLALVLLQRDGRQAPIDWRDRGDVDPSDREWR